jgi:hypothetical protein
MHWTWRPVGASCWHQPGEPPYVLRLTIVFPVSGGSGLARLRLLFKVVVGDGSGRLGQVVFEFVSCSVQQLSSD